MYNKHQAAIQPAKKKLEEIQFEINFMCEVSPDLNPQDLEVISDIARILVVAQRQLSYAYVARYYLAGRKKQEFMDYRGKCTFRSVIWVSFDYLITFNLYDLQNFSVKNL